MPEFSIWEGVYPDFRSAPAKDAVSGGGGGVFEGEEWLAKMAARANQSLERLMSGRSIPEAIPEAALSREYPLAMVVALTPEGSAPVRVVDFGGGLANGFAGVRAALPDERRLVFHCVENPAICALGRRIFSSVAELHFHESLDDAPDGADIVHAGSSLQYIEDWKGMLARLLRLRPRYLVLSDLPAGDIPTFVSVQNYYRKRMRHWFWNIGEFLAELERQGCRLLFRSHYEGIYLGKPGPYPMANFPPRYRLGYACNLVLTTAG